ncbi:MAG: hypothetical protein EOO73_33205 [Myxococcales bacterium]|nr:MAG: hypothetical protein EOO73_33205 [Myxococcales bacterium]
MRQRNSKGLGKGRHFRAQVPIAWLNLLTFVLAQVAPSAARAQQLEDVAELRQHSRDRASGSVATPLTASDPRSANSGAVDSRQRVTDDEQGALGQSGRDPALPALAGDATRSPGSSTLTPADLAAGKGAPGAVTTPGAEAQETRELVTGGDKSGVSSRAISVPQGAGKLDGMGESFSAQLSTGAATFSVPIVLPTARGDAQPSLGLSYSSSSGAGNAGMGWSIGVPFIARQTDRGIPKYDDRSDFHHEQDRFVFNGGQELVPICKVGSGLVCTGALAGEVMPPWAVGWQYFRPRVEGGFQRFFWSANRLTWRVQDKSGVTMELGVALDGKNNVTTLERNPENTAQIYAWHIAREYDTYGSANPATGNPTPVNVVVYRYLNVGGQAYLTDIFDTTPAQAPTTYTDKDFAHHVRLVYEDRPDPSVSYRSGWKIEQTRRLKRIDVTSKTYDEGTSGQRALVRRYHLGYDSSYHGSYLSSLQLEGRCAAKERDAARENNLFVLPDVTGCGALPAMAFAYTHVGATATDEGFEQLSSNVRSISQAPGVVAKSLGDSDVNVELFDSNSDGLPDILHSLPWSTFLNSPRGLANSFAAGVAMSVDTTGASAGDAAAMRALGLDNANVATLDYDGDGITDLVHTPAINDVRLYSLVKGAPSPQWQARKITAQQDVKIDFRNGARATRVADVNFDGLVDVLVATGEELQTFFSLGRYVGGQGKFGSATRTGVSTATFSDAPVRACLPWAGQSVDFDNGTIQLAEMNGDGIVDVAKLSAGNVQFWPGRGDGYWGSRSRQTLKGCATGVADTGVVSMSSSPYYSGFRPERMRLDDVNGDGLSDIVQIDEDSVSVWLNVDGRRWTKRQRLTGMPSAARDLTRVRLADINGSGTPDVFWGNGGDYRYLDFADGKQAGLLTVVANGLGKTTTLEYSTSTAEMLAAEQNQVVCDPKKPWSTPWCSKMPTVVQVIKRVTESDNLTVAGAASNLVTEYAYRDPFYDGRQREFRGFRTALSRRIGDANEATSVVEQQFLLGECQDETVGSFDDGVENCADAARENPREALKGLPYVATTFSDLGIYHSTQATTFRLRHLYTGRDGRFVREAFAAGTRTTTYDSAAGAVSSTRQESFTAVELERGYDAAKDPLKVSSFLDDPTTIPAAESSVTVQLQLPAYSQYAVLEGANFKDFFGNDFLDVAKGCVAGPACPTAGTGMTADERIYSYSLPSLPSGQETNWLYRTAASYVTGSAHTTVKRNQRATTYNAQGSALNISSVLVGSGTLDRRHAGSKPVAPTLSSAAADGTSSIMAFEYDAFGNVIAETQPMGRCRRIAYDSLEDATSGLKLGYATLPVSERLFPAGCDLGTALASGATYDRGFGSVDSALDFASQRTALKFDGLGRVVESRMPHADGTPTADTDVPSMVVEYTLPPTPATKYSIIRVRRADGATENATDYVETYEYVDGFGRTRATLTEADTGAGDGGQWIVSGMTRLNAKGAVLMSFLPYFSNATPTAFPLATTPTSKYKRQLNDPFGRPYRLYERDGGIDEEFRHHPLSSDSYDSEDRISTSPHYQTFTTVRRDGHGRVIATTTRDKVASVVEATEARAMYLPTGEPEVMTRLQPAKAAVTPVVRWMRYDSEGHLVLNVEANTTVGFTTDFNTSASTVAAMKAWRYVYNVAGELVGTSDALGCGENYYYDGVGRLVAEDFSPCLNHHRDWVAPNLTPGTGYGTGVDALYIYDSIATRPGGAIPDSFTTSPPKFLEGRLVGVYDRGQNSWLRYDGRGRTVATYKRVAAPGTPVQDLAAAYANDWFVREASFDAADREVLIGTGAKRVSGTQSELLGVDGASDAAITYSRRGTVTSVAGSYGTIVQSTTRDADGLLTSAVWGDVASTTTTRTYDLQRRLSTLVTKRIAPGLWTAPGDYTPSPVPSGAPSTFQLVLQSDKYTYDLASNPTKIEDLRTASEWPAGALPVTRSMAYDSLYRVTAVDYAYSPADDSWTSPHAADLGGATDSRRATPSPHVQFATRAKQQTFAYDWLGNVATSGDDQSGFYDRSLGEQTHDTSARYRLKTATGAVGSPRTGSLTVSYLDNGNVSSLVVRRAGACLPTSSPCNARFDYQWDEVGRLQSATRNDFVSETDPLGTAEASLSYIYDARDDRVVKSATAPTGPTKHAVYVFESFELRGATFDATTKKYQRDATTEVPSLWVHGERLAKIAYYPASANVPRRSGATVHVFLQMEDGLGSSSLVVDKDTSELVERRTYLSYGATESDYRPARWKGARDDKGFTGKEEDIEVGLEYFGKRYLNPYLGRWMSPDPLALHTPGQADANLYAYVAGSVFRGVDPVGLSPWEYVKGLGAGAVDAAKGMVVEGIKSSAVAQYIEAGKAVAKGDYKGAVVHVVKAQLPVQAALATVGMVKSIIAVPSQVKEVIDAKNDYEAGKKAFAPVMTIASTAAMVYGGVRGASPKAPTRNLPKAAAPEPPPNGRFTGAGGCFVAGTAIATSHGFVPIEAVTLGSRVDAGNPACALQQIEPDAVSVRVHLRDGETETEIQLLRTLGWLEQSGLSEGKTWMELPEVAVKGWATLDAVEPPPTDAGGSGCLVRATFKRLASRTLILSLWGTSQVLELTPSHPLFLKDVGWVSASALHAGDALESDQGTVIVAGLEDGSQDVAVFNLEVADEHAYRVGEMGLWAHNQSATGGKTLNVAPEGGAATEGAAPGEWKGPTDYSHIPDPKSVGKTTRPTSRQVKAMKEANRAHNDGVLRSDESGTPMVDSPKSQKGVTPPRNGAQVDHIVPVDKGGTRTQANLRLTTGPENRAKSNK